MPRLRAPAWMTPYERVMWRTREGPIVRADLGPCLDVSFAQTRGYPVTGTWTAKGYRTVRVARLVLETHLDRPIRPGFSALHHCDRPVCVRPSHLYEGTQTDNMRDMCRRGRHGMSRPDIVLKAARNHSGEKSGRTRLNDVAVRTIRYLASRGVSNVRLASAYKLSRANIADVVTRRSWKHLPMIDEGIRERSSA